MMLKHSPVDFFGVKDPFDVIFVPGVKDLWEFHGQESIDKPNPAHQYMRDFLESKTYTNLSEPLMSGGNLWEF